MGSDHSDLSLLKQTNELLRRLLQWSKRMMSIEDESEQESAKMRFLSALRSAQQTESRLAQSGKLSQHLARLSQLERQSVGMRLELAKAHQRQSDYHKILDYLDLQLEFIQGYHRSADLSADTSQLQLQALEDFQRLVDMDAALHSSMQNHDRILSAQENHLAALTDFPDLGWGQSEARLEHSG